MLTFDSSDSSFTGGKLLTVDSSLAVSFSAFFSLDLLAASDSAYTSATDEFLASKRSSISRAASDLSRLFSSYLSEFIKLRLNFEGISVRSSDIKANFASSQKAFTL